MSPQQPRDLLGVWRRREQQVEAEFTHLARVFRRVSAAGMALGALWLVAASTPSLLPRPWWLQGVVAAVSAECGYIVGFLLGAVVKAAARWLRLEASVDRRRGLILGWVLLVLLILFACAFPFLTIGWQQYVTRYVGLDPPGLWYPVGATAVAVTVSAFVLLLYRIVDGVLNWFLRRAQSRIVREATARVVATAATGTVVVLAVNLLIQPAVMGVVGFNSDRVNRESPTGKSAPTSSLRSGGPGSPYSWNSLGQDGATFVVSGPSAAQIRSTTGRVAQEPIRVFVGNHQPINATADLVIGELDRTHAWDRKAILVETATSTGFINTWSAAAFEYLLEGDTAIASMAYSDLPSAFGLMTARQDPPEAGRALLDRVRTRIAAMPANKRPKLYVGGESLGAYGSETAFSSPEQILQQVDGALWSGTPMFSRNRNTLTQARAPGSTTIVPVINNGAHIRFAGNPSQLSTDEYGRPLGQWQSPRVVYLQHASDPVAWWSTDLLFQAPEWLSETRRNTPMAQMSWTPIVTFWQVTADMLVSNDVPGGFGHRYFGTDMVPAWAAVLGITDRSQQQLDAIIDAVGR